MTGGVCPVHGEYAPTGVCRWCEAPAAKAKAARMKVLREAVVLADWRRNLRAPLSWRMEYADPVTLVGLNAAEESRLLAQHAALRWERVARRWNWKHRNPKGLDERERAYVWRFWLAQQQRMFDDGDWLRRQQERFIAAGIPKEWP